jgi:KUP system potassium uptake protein
LNESALPITELAERLKTAAPMRVKGTAVYLTRDPMLVPHSLLLNLKHNKVLHERIVFLGMFTDAKAYVPETQRVHIETLSPNVFRVNANHGFAEDPRVPAVIERCRGLGLDINVDETTFFVGRETLLATDRPGMAIWRERLFSRMARNARRATRFFKIPPNRVVEIGAEIEL